MTGGTTAQTDKAWSSASWVPLARATGYLIDHSLRLTPSTIAIVVPVRFLRPSTQAHVDYHESDGQDTWTQTNNWSPIRQAGIAICLVSFCPPYNVSWGQHDDIWCDTRLYGSRACDESDQDGQLCSPGARKPVFRTKSHGVKPQDNVRRKRPQNQTQKIRKSGVAPNIIVLCSETHPVHLIHSNPHVLVYLGAKTALAERLQIAMVDGVQTWSIKYPVARASGTQLALDSPGLQDPSRNMSYSVISAEPIYDGRAQNSEPSLSGQWFPQS
ncbi:hypothetical protein DEU56DRAFT_905364 [Suillus clintonianus]|uniref:uncharacterized protein n=1 Tax=Suillus clintonianus TaxID=1904413 RepID=UPI001B87FA61|nr:uncharacterized protein DEU56DRAFT_905364 [Suillus clintonianus]KAG2114409.1 hypothetical protein DEU56DRAFT_905364 [Suillus clintonianus]